MNKSTAPKTEPDVTEILIDIVDGGERIIGICPKSFAPSGGLHVSLDGVVRDCESDEIVFSLPVPPRWRPSLWKMLADAAGLVVRVRDEKTNAEKTYAPRTWLRTTTSPSRDDAPAAETFADDEPDNAIERDVVEVLRENNGNVANAMMAVRHEIGKAFHQGLPDEISETERQLGELLSHLSMIESGRLPVWPEWTREHKTHAAELRAAYTPSPAVLAGLVAYEAALRDETNSLDMRIGARTVAVAMAAAESGMSEAETIDWITKWLGR